MNDFIRLNNISFGYQKSSFQITDVSLGFHCGEITVLAGKNGSGKTTLSKLMIGILKPQKGDVAVNGKNIKKQSLAQTAQSVGYLFQNPERQLFNSSVLEEIIFSLKHKGEDEQTAAGHAKDLLKEFSMADKADDYPLRLSGGEKQRLALLTVFAMKPQYYILDEPSSGIDRENKQILMDMLKVLKGTGAGICMITHDRPLMEALAGRVITIEKGRVASDENA